MLSQSTFPVTGSHMQTDKTTNNSTFDEPVNINEDSLCTVPPLLLTFKEPQKEDTNIIKAQSDVESSPSSSDDEVSQKNYDTSKSDILLDNSISISKFRRRKARWKLKFHHQALPPAYLSHYEAALAQKAQPSKTAAMPELLTTDTSVPAPLVPPNVIHPIADVQRWLHKIAMMQKELCTSSIQSQASSVNLRRSVITSGLTKPVTCNLSNSQNFTSQPVSRPPMKYSDLPYMGEITLENSKPRRGRKPKKADICHLIYKNYGTILPGTPGHEEKFPVDKKDKTPQTAFQRSDIQNKISSLLEKRLTQESNKSFDLQYFKEQDEPLNLCLKDNTIPKTDISYDQDEINVVCMPYSSRVDSLLQKERISRENVQTEDLTSNPGIVYWPNAGMLMKPMALQSQFLYCHNKDQQNLNLTNDVDSMEIQKVSPNVQVADKSSEIGSRISKLLTPNRKRATSQCQPVKRKRSAIFIPPLPTENNNNPATEVSICKFKFTGGAKPSLQEKKSLSVDSGGNFRYYSGTGDKSMRGYEFFPRESIQQPVGQNSTFSSTFLNAPDRIAQPNSHIGKCSLKDRQDDGRRKRKTRKSLQREKLEQTFKEKGFLIQTQHLESAEGATYCKFRQLRKFTRYLFRSWKDYLPGNVRELTDGLENENHDSQRKNKPIEIPVAD